MRWSWCPILAAIAFMVACQPGAPNTAEPPSSRGPSESPPLLGTTAPATLGARNGSQVEPEPRHTQASIFAASKRERVCCDKCEEKQECEGCVPFVEGNICQRAVGYCVPGEQHLGCFAAPDSMSVVDGRMRKPQAGEKPSGLYAMKGPKNGIPESINSNLPFLRQLPSEVAGSLSTEDVSTAVHHLGRRGRDCYLAGLEQDPSIAGRIVVQVEVSAKGSVTKATVRLDELGDGGVAKCLASAIKSLEFPESADGQPTSASIPFALRPL